MKKIALFFALAMILSSCAVGTYMPNAYNNYGTQTQVVLDRANFRIVRDVEVVVEVDNTHLKRKDVEKSAYGELLRQYKLTGSQAFINVSIEEVRRESSNIFRYFFSGLPKRKQYVAARATIIEFLQDNGEPIKSIASPYTQTATATNNTSIQQPQPKKELSAQELEQANYYYLAYLAKTNLLDYQKIETQYDVKRIKKLAVSSTTDELLERSKGHSESIEQYANK